MRGSIQNLASPSADVTCVLKTAGFGYDGKGQAKLSAPHDIESAFDAIKGSDAILEAFVDFRKELSVVAARGTDGGFVDYGVMTRSSSRSEWTRRSSIQVH